MSATVHRAALLVLFTVSGFSGLVYESIWSEYLELLLGHAAYARTLVLVIFMGGLAVGSWLAARFSPRIGNLLLGYAVAEGLVGLAGMGFHPVFDAGLRAAYETVLPALGSTTAAATLKWTAAALVIAPQTVLLGMTFPLISGALVRQDPARSGPTIAMLYFTNSIGAAIGVLVAGFVLIPAAGLPGTILVAGVINVVLALLVYLMSRAPTWAGGPLDAVPASVAVAGGPRLLLAAALVTGCASFMYEIGWLRLLSLVLGSSTHAFELMLSAFILGLALGSLWIKRRIAGLRDPLAFLGIVQVLMGVLAAATLLGAEHVFALMGFLLRGLEPNDQGYTLYNAASHGIAMLVMVPATFCAGMTLPLITHMLVASGRGERAIGQVYATNTAGSILGVVIAVHLAMPFLGLKGVMLLGAALDVGLGVVLLARAASGVRWTMAAAGVAALVLVLGGARMDPRVLASEVFRTTDARSLERVSVPYHRDGKTATVTLVSYPLSILGLKTNGKTDATMRMDGGPPTSDEYTMVLLGALPLGARPDARRVAAIGFGAGLTSHVLLASDALERLDTIEIEPLMTEAAAAFRPLVERAFTDPRSRVHFEDARTWLALAPEPYDIIVSEPSHPWVSGVASLYTREFYRFARTRLRPDGIFAQWLHTAGLAPELLAVVLEAIAEAFPDYVVYNLNGTDLLLLAGPAGRLGVDAGAMLANPALAAELARIGVRGEQEIAARFLGSRATLHPYIRGFKAPANSDYFPILDLQAVRSRFREQDNRELLALTAAPYPVVEMLAGERPRWTRTDVLPVERIARLRAGALAMAIRDHFARAPADREPATLPEPVRESVVRAELAWRECGTEHPDAWQGSLRAIADATVSFLRPRELADLFAALGPAECTDRWSAPQREWVALIGAVSGRDADAMAETATALLADTAAPDQIAYLVGVGMLGHLAADRAGAALELWRGHAGRIIGRERVATELLVLEALARGG